MTTITAVELRKDMGNIFKRVQRGEKIRVTYRRGVAVELQNVDDGKHMGNSKAILEFLEENKHKFAKARKALEGVDAKEVMHKHWIEKYGGK